MHLYFSNENNDQEITEEFNIVTAEKLMFIIYFYTNLPSDGCYIL